MKLVLGQVTEEYSDKPAGEILRQNPDPADTQEVLPGTKIDFVVSLGPEEETGNPQTYMLILPLPMDRDFGELQVFQDYTCIVSQQVDCRPGSFATELEGNGEYHVTAYLDGEVIFDQTITVGDA